MEDSYQRLRERADENLNKFLYYREHPEELNPEIELDLDQAWDECRELGEHIKEIENKRDFQKSPENKSS